jgi:hypothetical protein
MVAMINLQLAWQGRKETLLSLMIRDVRLGRIAAKGIVSRKIESIEQRSRRWLKNKQIKPQLIYDPLAKKLLFSRKRLRLQIDRTLVKKVQRVDGQSLSSQVGHSSGLGRAATQW